MIRLDVEPFVPDFSQGDDYDYYAAVHEFYKHLGATANFKPQKGDMKQVSYWGATNIRRHGTKLSRPGFVHPCVTVLVEWASFLRRGWVCPF